MAWRTWREQNADEHHHHDERREIEIGGRSFTQEIFEDGALPRWCIRNPSDDHSFRRDRAIIWLRRQVRLPRKRRRNAGASRLQGLPVTARARDGRDYVGGTRPFAHELGGRRRRSRSSACSGYPQTFRRTQCHDLADRPVWPDGRSYALPPSPFFCCASKSSSLASDSRLCSASVSDLRSRWCRQASLRH